MPSQHSLAGEWTVARAFDARSHPIAGHRLTHLVEGGATLRLWHGNGTIEEVRPQTGDLLVLAPGRRELRLSAGSTWRWLRLADPPVLTGMWTRIILPPRAHALLAALLAVQCGADRAAWHAGAMTLTSGLVHDGLPAVPGDPRLLALIEEISMDPGKVRGVAELERRLEVSPAHLRRMFHAATGLSPRRWLQRTRLRRARQLLDGWGLEAGEVARQVGLSDARALARMHRRAFGTGLRRSS